MGVVEGVGDRRNDLNDLCFRHSGRVLAAQQLRGVGSLHVVHRDPQLPFVFTAVVDADDVFVVQVRGQVGLAIKALAKFAVRGQFAGQNFEGIAAGQPRVLREIHLAHAAGPQPPDDGVSSEHLAFG